jgi:dipeptidase D
VTIRNRIRLASAILALAFPLALGASAPPPAPSPRALEIAAYAKSTYDEASVATLGELVAFRTVATEGVPNAENPEVRKMTAYLSTKAKELGFGFEDHGAVVLISTGPADAKPENRLGLIVHGDVQPVDPSKWAKDPFRLDAETEPGKLLGRGSEDDKGPIATALYAMKALADKGLTPGKRIDLVISYTEESDWVPFQKFLDGWTAPALNVGLDADYPVVIAEKGWCSIELGIDPVREEAPGPKLTSFSGGFFLSQVPEDAEAVISGSTTDVATRLMDAARRDGDIRFTFEPRGGADLVVRARGVSAHSSTPWDGKNAIAHLAALLGTERWPDNQAARMVRLLNDLVGTGIYAEKFGNLAYEHPFMGKATLSLGTLKIEDGRLTAGLNLRRPVGRTKPEVETSILEAVEAWSKKTRIPVALKTDVNDPHFVDGAPHIPVLLGIFAHYTGQPDPKPISVGGGTHARLLPNGVNFGPGMPGEVYTGHSEHEWIGRDRMLLNLEMYTAMLAELAGR